MNIHIVCVGKCRERFWKEAVAEYSKRLSRFCKLTVTELADEKIPDNAGPAAEAAVLEKEGERILSALRPNEFVVTLCVEGRQKDSVRFAEFIRESALAGKSNLAFVIGGSLGLAEAVKQRSGLRLSFSEMTFPHQLMRVILLEQLYRAFKINANETYHK